MEHFKDSEFNCKCGQCDLGFRDMKDALLVRLANARELSEFYRVKFVINSAMRCKEHNEAIGGKLGSSHLFGYAVDISCKDSHERFIITKCLMTAGFKRIEVREDWVHADVDPTKPQEVLWLE